MIRQDTLKGIKDVSTPRVFISCPNPTTTVNGVTTVYATFTKRPPVGLILGDFTLTNCNASALTQLSGTLYSVQIAPIVEGTLTVQILANKFTDSDGRQNGASNTLTLTYVDDSGIVYDLQLATLSKPKHFRGHVASFSDLTDSWVTAGEMLASRNNVGVTNFDSTYIAFKAAVHQFGRVDYANYVTNVVGPDTGNFTTVNAAVTTTRGGVVPSTMSYKNGVDTWKTTFLTLMLAGRNSESYNDGNSVITYETGLTDVDLISRATTFRWEYYTEMSAADFFAGTNQDGIDIMTAVVPNVISTGSWFTNFMHWGWWELGYAPQYFALLDSLIGSADVYRGSYSSVAEYYWVREAIDSITANVKTVTINYTKKYVNSPYSKITTPAWVRIDLTGTSLAGLNITTSHGGKIRSMGSNVYFISINLDFNNTSITFDITKTTAPSYINLAKPIVSRLGNTITSDQNVKIALFSKLKAQIEIQAILEERQLTPSTSFLLAATLNTVTKDYYLAFINSEGVSGTLEF